MPARNHRWSDNYQFWFGLVSILFVFIGGIWHMSSRLTTIERNLAAQNQRIETGFRHVANSINGLDGEKTLFQAKIEQIYLRCCSELTAEK